MCILIKAHLAMKPYQYLRSRCIIPVNETLRGSKLKKSQTSQCHVFLAAQSHTSSTYNSRFMPKRLLTASCGIAIFSFLGVRAYCQSREEQDSSALRGPSPITLYQYQTCPFCCKTRAFLDYYGVGYETVEVNPLFRREIKFSNYRKVPFITADGVQVNDSSLVISVLQTCMVRGLSVPAALDFYPEMTTADSKGKPHSERMNKYFIMFGEEGDSVGMSIDERREEREWREWVDKRLVHAIPPNIYRTLPEALQAFDYVSRVGNFNTVERVLAKYVGTVSMYFISKSLRKKYNLKPDVRQSLYDFCNQWMKAIGKHRKFMGGNRPNLADLAVYGVLSAIEGLDSFSDMTENTRIGHWYWAVKEEVLNHRGADLQNLRLL